MRRFTYCDLNVGDVLMSKDGDFLLLDRRGETFSWLDLRDKWFYADLNPVSNVPSSYTILRGNRIVRRGLE